MDKGFEAGTLTATIPLYEEEHDDVAVSDRFFARLSERLQARPEVDAAGGVLIRPLETSYGYDYPFTVEGRPPEEQAGYPYANYQAATPGYFDAMGIELRAGRGFGPADDGTGEPVVVIGQALATRFWGDPGSAVGGRLKFGPPESELPWLRVIGVVEDARYRSVREGRLDLYVPTAQSPWKLSHLALRTRGDPLQAVPLVRQVVAELDPRIRVADVATMREMVGDALARPRYVTLVVGAFAGVAYVLAALGLYGILSYGALLRRREMGLRLAVGARPADVGRLIVGWGVGLTGLGLTAGAGTYALAGPVLEDWLYGVPVADPVTLVAVAVGFTLAALAAGLRPALQAGRVQPHAILRSD
ncbi:MAG TPA: ABC transporter permease [Longimicrobiales bacterium]|nr:ABC transporter permease [Longimicrobiales bacterium]